MLQNRNSNQTVVPQASVAIEQMLSILLLKKQIK
jgi:hypothetical protein